MRAVRIVPSFTERGRSEMTDSIGTSGLLSTSQTSSSILLDSDTFAFGKLLVFPAEIGMVVLNLSRLVVVYNRCWILGRLENLGGGINESPLSLAKYGRSIAALQKYQCQEELYRLPSPPLLSALALMQYAIYSAQSQLLLP